MPTRTTGPAPGRPARALGQRGARPSAANPSGPTPRPDGATGLGSRLRELRHARGLSLSTVADQTGLSRSFLSLVENDRSDIALSRLLRITELYGIPLGKLFEDVDEGPVHVTRAREARLLRTREHGATIHILSAYTGQKFEPYRIRLEPGSRLSSLRHAGDEFATVLQGAVRLTIWSRADAASTYDLGADDVVYFAGNLHHTYENVGRDEAVIIGAIEEA
jgi:transcriptional regulator with XRE-family HTH domain